MTYCCRRRSSLLALRYSYSIGSSALSKIDVGTSRSSALAVVILSTVFVFRRSLHREVGWFLAFQDAVDVGGGKPIQRGLINPEGDQSAFGDETAEVMGSNGAMIVPQDIKPKQTVRQGFRQCLIIALRSSTCRVQLHWRLGQGADDGRMARVAEAWDRSTAPGATSRSTISSASVRLQRLRLACRSGARLIPILATRHGRARPGHACLWTDILNPL